MNTLLSVIVWFLLIMAVLYLFLIMPKFFNRSDITEFTRVMYAHRGLHDNDSDAPENSMPAFRKAVKAGYGIELDIQLTKDWIPVVFHDYSLERICGVEGMLYEYTYEELQQFVLCNSSEKIPKLEDVLKLVNGRVPLIIEFKGESVDTSLCPIADELLQKYNGMYCIESFNPMMVYWYRLNRPNVIRGQLSDTFFSSGEKQGTLYFFLENLLFNCLTKPDFIAYNHKNHRKLSRILCHKLFRNTAVAWTIKDEEQLNNAKKHFDAFIFDSFIPSKEDNI